MRVIQVRGVRGDKGGQGVDEGFVGSTMGGSQRGRREGGRGCDGFISTRGGERDEG